ncbi:MAG: Fic family protein [Rhodoferax sp.]|nr:Fic family protein [Rhodoferax sp.]MDP3654101.1 Fic family protein [Rhodoferax sp.]
MQISSIDLGYSWISKALEVTPVQPFRVTSGIGSGMSALQQGRATRKTYTRAYAPEPTLAGHLTFALKYEGVELDFLARVFQRTGADFVREWVRQEPTSAYARRAGFLFEWLTGQEMDGIQDASGNYVDAIDAKRYFVATQADKNRRWRINDNLPGTPAFCPMIERSKNLRDTASLSAEIQALMDDFGEDTLLRAVHWLTVKESRASFAIESEGKEEDRIHRFARAMVTHCGQIEDPLSEASLETLQSGIMGAITTGFRPGLRRSPVFVGHTADYQPVIDYLAPGFKDVPDMMEGLRAVAQRTVGQHAVLRAAALSFGLVYIHPLADGNGRISRFLINDTLRRDGVIPAPVILPVSAVISASAQYRHGYDQALEVFSKPLMREIGKACSFAQELQYEDGVRSNLQFELWEDALPSWRYPDLTLQTQYLSQVIDAALTDGLRAEAQYLSRYDQAEQALKRRVEGSSEDYARIIRSITKHRGVSGKLKKIYPLVFEDTSRSECIVADILRAFKATDGDGDDENPGPIETVKPIL